MSEHDDYIDLVSESSSDHERLLYNSDAAYSDSEEEYMAQLSCGLPVEDEGDDMRPCDACNCEFETGDVPVLQEAWDRTKVFLESQGFVAALPSMDDHFKRVFFLHVKDWQGRMDEVTILTEDAGPWLVRGSSEEPGEEYESDYESAEE